MWLLRFCLRFWIQRQNLSFQNLSNLQNLAQQIHKHTIKIHTSQILKQAQNLKEI